MHLPTLAWIGGILIFVYGSASADDVGVFEQHVEDAMLDEDVPGLVMTVIRNGEIVYTGAFGLVAADEEAEVNTNTLFQAASISKPVAALAVLRLSDAMQIDLHQPVNEQLRTWTIPDCEFTTETPITPAHLLGHCSGATIHGFRGYLRDATLPDLKQIIEGTRPANTPAVQIDFVPGSRFQYSGGGYCILQQLVEDQTGKPFAEAMHELVLQPLGMNDSTYVQLLPEDLERRAACGHDAAREIIPGGWCCHPEMAAAGLWTTSDDLARFLLAIDSAHREEADALIAPETCQQFLTPQTEDGPGLGIFLDRTETRHTVWHNGANNGFRALITFDLVSRNGLVVLANSDNAENLYSTIARFAGESF